MDQLHPGPLSPCSAVATGSFLAVALLRATVALALRGAALPAVGGTAGGEHAPLLWDTQMRASRTAYTEDPALSSAPPCHAVAALQPAVRGVVVTEYVKRGHGVVQEGRRSLGGDTTMQAVAANIALCVRQLQQPETAATAVQAAAESSHWESAAAVRDNLPAM